MRIRHVCRVAAPQVGGMESVVDGLVRWQRAQGHEVEVVSLEADRTLNDPAYVHRLPRIGSRRWPFARGLADRLAGADVVHVHGVDGLLDQVLRHRRRLKYRVGVSTHGGYFHTPWAWPVKQLWLRTGTRLTLRHCDGVWFTSVADQQRFAPAGRVGRVLVNGLNLSRWLSASRRPEPGRLLVWGRLAAHKAVEDVIMGVVGQNLTLVVAGVVADEGYARRLRRLASEQGVQVLWRGGLDQDALEQELARASCAIFPSRSEGFGLALVETMAAGVPVVARDIPAFRERLVHGETGWLTRDVQAALQQRAHLEVTEGMAVAGRASVAEYDWSVRGPAFMRAYADIQRTRR